MSDNKILTETIAYPKDFLKSPILNMERGWGCGYCLIPQGHPAISLLESNYGNPYYHVPDFSEEMTLTKWVKREGMDYLKIGFDTAHSWNNSSHDEEWVTKKTEEMREILEGIPHPVDKQAEELNKSATALKEELEKKGYLKELNNEQEKDLIEILEYAIYRG